jgi:hypothetical protein
MRIANSEECCKSELDLMSLPPTQTEIEDSVFDDIKPHPTFSDGVITFDITGDSTHYLDLADTELYVKLILQKKKKDSADYVNAVFSDSGSGADAVKASLISPINNIIHSLFSQIQVYLNGREVENSNANYMFKAYLANLLSYGKEAKESFLASEGYFKDTAGEMETLPVGDAAVTAGTCKNKGHQARWELFKNNQPVELRGRLQCDIFNMNRYMLSNVNVTIKLSRNKPEFYLMGVGDNHKIIVSDCFLRVRRVKISNSAMLKHAMALESTTAKYPIKRCVIKQFTLPYNASKASINGIHTGLQPSRVVIGFLDNTSYNGSLTSNPYFFKHLDINRLTLKLSSKSVPYSSGIEMDFEGNCYQQAYRTLFQNIQEVGNDITYADYKNGYTLFAFSLSPDQCSGAEHFSLFKDGSLDLDIEFKNSINKSLTTIFFLEFDSVIEVSKQRNIIFDYQV